MLLIEELQIKYYNVGFKEFERKSPITRMQSRSPSGAACPSSLPHSLTLSFPSSSSSLRSDFVLISSRPQRCLFARGELFNHFLRTA